MYFRGMTAEGKLFSDHVRACLTPTSCVAYRGHRVRQDHGSQRDRCHPQSAGTTPKEEDTGWALVSLVPQGLCHWQHICLQSVCTLFVLLCAENWIQTSLKIKLSLRRLVKQEASHTAPVIHLYHLLTDYFYPIMLSRFIPEEETPPFAPPLCFINVMNNFLPR